jgi:hypothetical protein
MQQAVSAIRTGQCDSAIVGGVKLLLKPTCSLQFHRLSMLSPQGMCKAFDASGTLCLSDTNFKQINILMKTGLQFGKNVKSISECVSRQVC